MSEQAAGKFHRRPVAAPLRACVAAGMVLGGLLAASPAFADAQLARAKNCMACHALDKKLIGPSYKDVAMKYAGDRNAVAKLAKKVRLRFDRHEQRHMLLYPERGLVLNDAAAAIAKKCDGTRSLAEIARELAAEHAGADVEVVERDVVTFVTELRDKGLLE